MDIRRINEYFLKAQKLNSDLSDCDRTSSFRGELGCTNPVADITIGIKYDLLGNIIELKSDFKYANRYLCAFVSRAAEILPGLNCYRMSSNKISAQILKFFGLEGKETRETEALKSLLLGIC